MKPRLHGPAKRRVDDWFAGLPTGPRMLVVLALALLPLGIIAVVGTLNAARSQRANDVLEAQSVLALTSQRLSSAITRASATIRVASGTISGADPATAGRGCERTAQQIDEEFDYPVRFALYIRGNQRICNTPGYAPSDLFILPPTGMLSLVQVDGAAGSLRLILYNSTGGVLGEVMMSAETLRALARPASTPVPMKLELIGNDQAIVLHDDFGGQPMPDVTTLSMMIMGDRLELRLQALAPAFSIWAWLMILLPILLWLVGAGIGWLVVDRLLLRPLGSLERAISAYQPGDRDFQAPTSLSPAREISGLGEAFSEVTRTVARHEDELEAAVDRQTRLVREVHHRVKNNLQVVASLLNIHSRGASSSEASGAYASIQRRVDALAVVHRNHYAELEATPGVALRALISELGASLRASAPAGATRMQIRLSLDNVHVNQDVAVAVAFLITEAVEFAMLCGGTEVSILLEPTTPTQARLTIESGQSIKELSCSDAVRERFERIMTGLSRQLRSTLDHDPNIGRFSVMVMTLPPSASGEA